LFLKENPKVAQELREKILAAKDAVVTMATDSGGE
jgi:hypothetical protein